MIVSLILLAIFTTSKFQSEKIIDTAILQKQYDLATESIR